MDKQINHDNHYGESKRRTHSKLPDDGDPWAPNILLKSGAKEKEKNTIMNQKRDHTDTISYPAVGLNGKPNSTTENLEQKKNIG